MADDIVARLRGWVDRMDPSLLILTEAANEIERLRTAGDELATRLRWWTDNTDPSYPDHQALRNWEQVTRG